MSNRNMSENADSRELFNISRVKVKWYDTILLLVGSVLAAVDPVTDILTLREFYLKDHKIWFGVGLVFVVWPSLSMTLIHCRLVILQWKSKGEDKRMMGLIPDVIFGWNPLSLFCMRFKAFILCARNFKKLWHDESLEDYCREQIQQLIFSANSSGMIEAVLESAPQFIIQLHAVVVLQEQVSIIQMISLCASFLSITWTFANGNVRNLMSLEGREREIDSTTCKIKTTVVFYLSWLFHLSSRLLAITFFTVGFKWWAFALLVFHFIVLVALYRVWGENILIKIYGTTQTDDTQTTLNEKQRDCMRKVTIIIGLLAASLSTTLMGYCPGPNIFAEKDKSLLIRALSLFFLFTVIENVVMICVFYSKEEPHAWYSVPVTVCVCVFSLVGGLVKVALYYFILWERD